MPILLTEQDVKALLTMDDLIEVMASALADFSAGRVTQPLRTVIEVGEQRSFYGLMPAYMPSRPALGTKLVTAFDQPALGTMIEDALHDISVETYDPVNRTESIAITFADEDAVPLHRHAVGSPPRVLPASDRQTPAPHGPCADPAGAGALPAQRG